MTPTREVGASRRLILVATLLACLILEHGRVTGLVSGVALAIAAAALCAVALLARAWPSVHLGLFVVLAAAAAWSPIDLLQVYALQLPLLFALSLLMLWPAPQVREAARSWFRRGRMDMVSAFFTLGTPPVAGAALIAWALWTDNIGAGDEMIRSVAEIPLWLLVLVGVPGFALLNAFAEELLYRGLVQQALTTALGDRPWIVLPLQASAFAALHYAMGFPNGVVGYVMVFTWGVVLGYLRRRTGGLLAPWVVHVAADLVIGGVLVSRL